MSNVGMTILHEDRELDIMYTWRGGCTVCITCISTGQDFDVFNFHDTPRHTEEAIRLCDEHIENARQEDEEWVEVDEEEEEYEDIPGPTAAEEWLYEETK